MKKLTRHFGETRRHASQRQSIDTAVREVCEVRRWILHALNVRTNHVHVVVSVGPIKPERALNAFKSYATRALREAGLLSHEIKLWARHGSTVYLWKERDVEQAVEYVLLGQDHECSLG